jgi:hypothetical protein
MRTKKTTANMIRDRSFNPSAVAKKSRKVREDNSTIPTREQMLKGIKRALYDTPLSWVERTDICGLRNLQVGKISHSPTFELTQDLPEVLNSAVEQAGFPELYALNFSLHPETIQVKMEGKATVGKRVVTASDTKQVKSGRYSLYFYATAAVHNQHSEDAGAYKTCLGTYENANGAMVAAEELRLDLLMVQLGISHNIDVQFDIEPYSEDR